MTGEEFMEHVELIPFHSCWEWNGPGGFVRGYGRCGHATRAHRLAYTLLVGPIPPGTCVLHRCDNPSCVRPSHLFLGTQTDNVRDMDAKGRRRPASGELNGRAKLTWGQVRTIRSRAGTNKAVGAEFEVDPSLISLIRNNKVWTDTNVQSP